MSESLPPKIAKRRRLVALIAVASLVLGALAFANRSILRDGFESILGNSFPGPGHGAVDFLIVSGDTGETVATNLVEQGIVKQFRSIYRLILDSGTVFYPGTYPMKLEMSNADALRVISDASNSSTNRVTVKEGWTVKQIFAALAEATSVSASEFESAASAPQKFGLPKDAVNLEGFLFPATYAFDPHLSAVEIIQIMVDRTFEELDTLGVPTAKQFETLIFASVIQKEARLAPDFGRVARVFSNRMDIGMHLQSDATVSYGTDGTTVTTTDEQRADPNGYNTYLYPGLPIGPISNPGRDAIVAASKPTAGNWLYFCTVNLETGETIFSANYEQHLVAVREFQSWLRANPGWNG